MARRSIRPLLGLAAALACAATLTTIRLDAQWGSSYDRMRCESKEGRDEYCRASISGDVRVVRQLSDRACIEGRTWKWDRDGIGVRDGCRAEFEYRRRDSGSGGGWGGSGGGWGGSGSGGWGGGGRRDRVTCQSQKDREQFCPAPIGGDVRVVRQMSDEDCVYRRNWNWSRDGIRVYGGCRAEFEYTRRSEGSSGGNRARVTCQSQKDRTQFCPAAIGGDVRVFRNISDTRCREGQNWSWSRDGIRVWEGCRAEFEYRQRQ